MLDGRATAPPEKGMATEFDVIVLGAGISGLVSASILLEQRYRRILVVDEYAQVGGNHLDFKYGDYTFDVGSLIFQDDSPLLRHLPELLPLYVPIKPSFGRLNPQGVVTRYPISVKDDLLSAGSVELCRILMSAAFARLFHRRVRDARSFARYWIGSRLLWRSGLEHYMERFYGVPAERIDVAFAEKRMLWIKEHASLLPRIRRWLKPSKKQAPNQQLVRPRDGFAHLYQPTVQRLEGHGVKFLLGARMQRITTERGMLCLQVGSELFSTPRVVSTMPVDRARELCGMATEQDLPTVTLVSLFFSFAGARGFPHSVLYNFSHAGAWKRLTMHSDFYGLSAGREFFCVEANAHHVGGSIEAAERDFRQITSANGLFVGDLRLEGSHTLSNAYPIYIDQAGERAARARAELKSFGIESFGRQGGFDYQPTARVSALEAEAALRRP